MPSFIVFEYVHQILGSGIVYAPHPPPVREQSRKGPSWLRQGYDMSCKTKLAGRHGDRKNVFSKKLQIETNPDNGADNILKYTAYII